VSDARVGGASEIEAEFVDSGVSESVTPDSTPAESGTSQPITPEPITPESPMPSAAADGLFPAPAPAPPHTGDHVVDRVLADLHVALGRDLDEQIEVADTVGEALHRRLQDLDSE
jgi:hypothetical protein